MSTRVALVRVGLEVVTALVEHENVLWDNLVEGEGAATKDLAGVAVAAKAAELASWLPSQGRGRGRTTGCALRAPSRDQRSTRWHRSGRLLSSSWTW